MRLTDFVARKDSNGDEFNPNDIMALEHSEGDEIQIGTGVELDFGELHNDAIMRESGLEKLEKKKSKKRQIEKDSAIEQNSESQGCCAPSKKQCVIF